MKKIINWSFGTFFRTIGRVLAYLLVGFLLAIVYLKLGLNFGYTKVNAQTLTNWAEGLPTLNRVQMYECQTSNKCYDKEVNIQGLVTVNGNRDIAISQSLTLDSGGISIQTNVNELKEGYLYLTNYYVCANYSLNNVDALIYNSNYGSPGVANTIYNSTSIATLSNIPGSGQQEFTSCKLYSGLYVPNVANNWATLRLKKSSSQSGTYISLIAVENRELGIYSDTIKTIVENANGNVQQAVNDVKEETKKTNDLISDTSDPDTEDSISDWSSKMSDNPLESVVMLPLNVLNSIQSGLSGTCSALNVPVPFIDETLNIPCISTIFSQIEGLTELWNTIGTIVAAIMLYQYLIYLYNWIDDTISLKTKRMQGWGSV